VQRPGLVAAVPVQSLIVSFPCGAPGRVPRKEPLLSVVLVPPSGWSTLAFCVLERSHASFPGSQAIAPVCRECAAPV